MPCAAATAFTRNIPLSTPTHLQMSTVYRETQAADGVREKAAKLEPFSSHRGTEKAAAPCKGQQKTSLKPCSSQSPEHREVNRKMAKFSVLHLDLKVPPSPKALPQDQSSSDSLSAHHILQLSQTPCLRVLTKKPTTEGA